MKRDPPLVLDVDGTLTHPGRQGIDPRIIDPIYEWNAPVVIATGKAFPYPVALCNAIGIPERVVAENGGIVYTGEELLVTADREAAEAAVREYEERGYGPGWGPNDTVNRWRETEIAVSRDQPEAPLREVAASHGLAVLDTGYAYHVVDPETSKGDGVSTLAEEIGFDLERTVAVGDSINDVSTFDVVGRAFAVANADEHAKRSADEVLEATHADGTLSVFERVRSEE